MTEIACALCGQPMPADQIKYVALWYMSDNHLSQKVRGRTRGEIKASVLAAWESFGRDHGYLGPPKVVLQRGERALSVRGAHANGVQQIDEFLREIDRWLDEATAVGLFDLIAKHGFSEDHGE